MKMMFGLAALLLAGGIFAVFGFQSGKAALKNGNGVGTRPGGVKSSIDVTRADLAPSHDLAVFAAGCFWGVEERFRQIPGVTATAVGYIGGKTKSPTYQQVCYEDTGHAEAVLIEFDSTKVSYDELLDIFFKNHNPTTKNRQGPDVGDQYRSAVFARNASQKAAAEKVIAKLNKAKFGGKIVTEIALAPEFWMAEEYHQQYCAKNGIAACPIR